jgi:histidinol-phosphatase (PHP family)
MIATYHNHSCFSDGSAEPEEIFAAAVAVGVEELGISDHWLPRVDAEPPAWAMPTERLEEYVTRLSALAARGGCRLRIGLEVDWLPEYRSEITACIERLPLDYVIGSVHEVDGFAIDSSARHWEALSPRQRDDLHRAYWAEVTRMAASGLFDIVGHIDLSRKFGHWPRVDLQSEIEAALAALAATEMVVELNTSGWHKPCASAYPELSILRRCREHGIAVTLSADAHRPEHLLRDFQRGVERLRAAGYAEVARFAGRRRSFSPLAAAAPVA